MWDLLRHGYSHRCLAQILKLPFHYRQIVTDTRFLRGFTNLGQEYVLETALYLI